MTSSLSSRERHDPNRLLLPSCHYSGAEHRILGLSPQYWTYTPMLVGDLLSLGLVNGVDCFVASSPRCCCCSPSYSFQDCKERVQKKSQIEGEPQNVEMGKEESSLVGPLDGGGGGEGGIGVASTTMNSPASHSSSSSSSLVPCNGESTETNNVATAAQNIETPTRESNSRKRPRSEGQSPKRHNIDTSDAIASIVDNDGRDCHHGSLASSSSYQHGFYFIPVSKCELCGILVNVERRSNGSILYVLDDGTGWIDCIAWEDDELYSLPPPVVLQEVPTLTLAAEYVYGGHSLGKHSNCHKKKCTTFEVGDVVRVWGKIHCVAVGGVRTVMRLGGSGDWEIRNGIREVQITSMERAGRTTEITGNMDVEVMHWLRCVQFGRKMGLGGGGINGINRQLGCSDYCNVRHAPPCPSRLPKSVNDLVNKDDFDHCVDETKTKQRVHYDPNDPHFDRFRRQTLEPIRNGAHVLDLLGPDIVSRVSSQRSPDEDDEYGAWRLFGPGCRCKLDHKEALLYCHCQATMEGLDPKHTFRDALLQTLLNMESALQPPDDSTELPQLHFTYKELLNDKNLLKVATQTVKDTQRASINVSRLYIYTFRALRKDGIIHLLCEEKDTYLLISRRRVLDPYLRKLEDKKNMTPLEWSVLQANRPAYLTNNSARARLRFVKRCLVGETRKNTGGV